MTSQRPPLAMLGALGRETLARALQNPAVVEELAKSRTNTIEQERQARKAEREGLRGKPIGQIITDDAPTAASPAASRQVRRAAMRKAEKSAMAKLRRVMAKS